MVKVLLLDEITVDMDVVGRLDLLDFFRQECEERGATILYATHIFDGLEAWLTHIAYIADGGLVKGAFPLLLFQKTNALTKKVLQFKTWAALDPVQFRAWTALGAAALHEITFSELVHLKKIACSLP